MRGVVLVPGKVQDISIVDTTRWAVALRPAYSPSGYAELLDTSRTKAEAIASRDFIIRELLRKTQSRATRASVRELRHRHVLLKRDAGSPVWYVA